jgi:nitroreductase
MIVNETLKIIKQRRSIRSFKDEKIKEEELQAVLEAGLIYSSVLLPDTFSPWCV